MEDLELIIQEAKEGKQKAFTTLYDKYYRLIRYVIRDIVKNDDVADDLLSVTFTKAFQKIDSFVDNISFEMWLKMIARNTAIDYIRRTKKEQLHHYIDSDLSYVQLEHYDLDPEQEIVKKECISELETATTLLRSKYRSLLDLRYTHDMSYKDIAKTLQIPEGTVKSDLNKAKKKLKQLCAA